MSDNEEISGDRTRSDEIATRVRALRKMQDMTVVELAKRCAQAGWPQLTEQALYKLETRRAAPSGTRRPVTVDELCALAIALNVSVNELLLGSHKITAILLVDPEGVDWECECGQAGSCPRPVAAEMLARHLATGS